MFSTLTWYCVIWNAFHVCMMLSMCLCVSLTFLDFFTFDTQVLKKDQPQSEPRHFWDVLRQGARIVLFSDLTEVQISSMFIRVLIPIILSATPFPFAACEVQLIVVCFILVEFPYFIHYCFTTFHVFQWDVNMRFEDFQTKYRLYEISSFISFILMVFAFGWNWSSLGLLPSSNVWLYRKL